MARMRAIIDQIDSWQKTNILKSLSATSSTLPADDVLVLAAMAGLQMAPALSSSRSESVSVLRNATDSRFTVDRFFAAFHSVASISVNVTTVLTTPENP